MTISARYARSFVSEELARRGVEVDDLMVGPVAVNPFVRTVVVVTGQDYRYGSLTMLPEFQLHLEPNSLSKSYDHPIVRRALESPQIQGFVKWVRFPFVEVEAVEGGHVVYFMDARYRVSRSSGFGSAKVKVFDN